MFYEIKGYWKDSKERIDGYIVCSEPFNEKAHGNIDEQIFHYDLGAEDLVTAMDNSELSGFEFVIEEFDDVSVNWSEAKKADISLMLINMWVKIGIDTPSNHDQIVEYCFNDICETADEKLWHSGDLEIAFRRWIEAQQKDNG